MRAVDPELIVNTLKLRSWQSSEEEHKTTKKKIHVRPGYTYSLPIRYLLHAVIYSKLVCVRVFVCCVFSSHSFWTSSSLDVPAGVTQEEDHTGFLIHLLSAVRALIFLARRIQPFLSLVDRQAEFCVQRFNRSPPVGHFFFFFFFSVRKISFAGIELTSQRVRRLHGYL